MTEILQNTHVALPEIILLATTCLALILDLFWGKRYRSIAFYTALTGLILSGGVSYLLIDQFKTIIFTGLFVSDDIAQIMKVFICISVALSFIYARQYQQVKKMPSGEFYVLGLFSTIGMTILVSAHSFITIYLGLELLSLPLYALVALQRESSAASEASMKYFVMGAIASGMLLFGISLIFAVTGKLDLLDVSNAISNYWPQQSLFILFALVFIIAGIGFKLAAVPFHMWAPDVYQGAPTSVTMFLSAAPKIAALGMAFRLLTLGLIDLSSQWQQIILVMALLSTGIGNFLALVQENIKRLLAYSAISHMGYALFGLVALTAAGYAAALYYVLVYALMSVAALGLVVLMSHSGNEIENVSDLKGLNKKNPWLAFMMMIIMLSMAGIPPTVGFFTKLLVLKALVDVHLTWVAVLGLVFAVVGAFYYLRIIKTMYFDEADSETSFEMDSSLKVVFSLNSLALLYLGIFPNALTVMCLKAFS